MSHYDYTFKILLLGDADVGKTEFTKRFCYNIFNPSERLTIGVDFHVKTIELNNTRVKLQIWDVGGEERFRFLLPTYCLGSSAAFLLYDITRPSTLDNISEWMTIIRAKGGPIPVVLIGSSIYSNIDRVVSRQEAISRAKALNIDAYGEVCYETGQNVEKAFRLLSQLTLGQGELDGFRRDEDLIYLEPLEDSPIFPFKIKTDVKINKYIELKLEKGKTNIYVAGKLFRQCKYLLFNISNDNINNYKEIGSIDEAAEILDNSMERRGSSEQYLTPEVEFWGHCSNLQVWSEMGYDTRILHRNLAFPLLKALVAAGDIFAKKVFKEQLVLRLQSGHPSVVIFLVNEGYLDNLTEEELDTVIEDPIFLKSVPKWFNKFKDMPDWLNSKIRTKLHDLKCPYCGYQVTEYIIQKFLKGRPLRCILCYTNLI
jgi:small GTP-binding protein